MSYFVILIGLSRRVGADAKAEKHDRLNKMYELIFSLGSAWMGTGTAIILKAQLTSEQVFDHIAPLVRSGDLITIIETSALSAVTIGLLADEEGFDALCPNSKKFDVSLSGRVFAVEKNL